MIGVTEWVRINLVGKTTARVTCPWCGVKATLEDHEIVDDGIVTPSVDCPNIDCDFHWIVALEGWNDT